MCEDYNALCTQKTWSLVPPPTHHNVLGSRWIFKIKLNTDGTVSQYKGKLVAQRYKKERFDYFETLNHVAKITMI